MKNIKIIIELFKEDEYRNVVTKKMVEEIITLLKNRKLKSKVIYYINAECSPAEIAKKISSLAEKINFPVTGIRKCHTYTIKLTAKPGLSIDKILKKYFKETLWQSRSNKKKDMYQPESLKMYIYEFIEALCCKSTFSHKEIQGHYNGITFDIHIGETAKQATRRLAKA